MTAPDHVVALVAGMAADRPAGLGATRLVCVDGPAGSGKTTLAAQLGALLPAQVVHMDDLYEGWTGMRAGIARLTEWVLEPLAAGRPGRYQRYDWGLGKYAERHTVPLADFLVVEGCGSASLSTEPYSPLVVWVEASDDVRLERGLERDGAALEPAWREFMRTERAHYAEHRTRERAHVRLDGLGNLVAP